MGMTLIVGNIKPIFQDDDRVKNYIKLLSRDQVPDDYFMEQLTPIISKIQQHMHSQLLGEPLMSSLHKEKQSHS